jgi:hypothetical protein
MHDGTRKVNWDKTRYNKQGKKMEAAAPGADLGAVLLHSDTKGSNSR